MAHRGYSWDRKFGEFGSYTQYERFNSQVTGRSGWSAWLAFVAAFPAKAAAVFLWGLLSTGFYLVLPFNFAAFEHSLTAGVHTHKTAAIFIACFIGALGFSWLKSYAELSLVQGVRFLAFRVFLEEGLRSNTSENTIGRLNTQPNQISQLAYVVDFVLSIIQSVGLAVVAIIAYKNTGLWAVIGIGIFTYFSFIMVRKIGVVFHRYIDSETARVELINAIAADAWRLRMAKLTDLVFGWLHQKRKHQEHIMKDRAKLQTINAVVLQSAVPVVVAVAVLVALVTGKTSDSYLSLLMISTLLYSAMGEVVANYRVIRLAVPMLNEWDERRQASAKTTPGDSETLLPALETSCVIRGAEAPELLDAARNLADVVVIDNPDVIPESLVNQLISGFSGTRRDNWRRLVTDFGLPPDTATQLGQGRAASLSLGEKARLWIALMVTLNDDTTSAVFFSDGFLAVMDNRTRIRVLSAVRGNPVPIVFIGTKNLSVGDCPIFEYRAGDIHRVVTSGADVASETSEHHLTPEAPQPMETSDSNEVGAGVPKPKPSLQLAQKVFAACFGRGGTTALLLVGALSALLTVGLPLVLETAAATISPTSIGLLVLVIAACLVIPVVTGLVQFRLPITNFSRLHVKAAQATVNHSTPARRGEYMGRFGDDFSTMQMTIPGALVSMITAVASVAVLCAIVAGQSLVLVVIILPIVVVGGWLYRRGSARLTHASDVQATGRDTFLSECAALITSRQLPSTTLVQYARIQVFEQVRAVFQSSTKNAIGAQLARGRDLSLLSAAILCIGVASVVFFPASNVISGAVVAYLFYSFATQVPTVISALQDFDLALITAGRVLNLTEFAPPHHQFATEHTRQSAQRIEETVRTNDETGGGVVEISGRSGAGKSTALVLYGATCDPAPVIVPDDLAVLQFAPKDETTDSPAWLHGDLHTRKARQQALVDYAETQVATSVVVLDETLSELPQHAQRAAMQRLHAAANRHNAVVIVVLHTAKESEDLHDFIDEQLVLD